MVTELHFPLDQAQVSQTIAEIVAFEQGYQFIRSRWYDDWCIRARKEISIGLFGVLKLAFKALTGSSRTQWNARQSLKNVLDNSEAYRHQANERTVQRVLADFKTYFDTVESKPLTSRQREAVASDEDATLVVAGAGTGKTSTILSKIGFLLKSGQCEPEEILAISFTRKSAEELAERVHQKLGVDLDIHTFHKLGLQIIAKAEGGKPRLAQFAESPAAKAKNIDSIINSLCKEDRFKKRLVNFLAYFRFPPKTSWHFSTMAEYHAWLESNRPVSLDGIAKKSFQECTIANWLILHGVPFEYEAPYEHDTKTIEYRQYCPDFHILKPNLYIEHFGVNEEGDPAPYIDAAKYRQGMQWKRDTHEKFGTLLIESYSWEQGKGLLLKNLEKNLREHGCEIAEISATDALALMNKNGTITGFGELVATFLTLYKGNGSKLASKVDDLSDDSERNRAFLDLFDAIFAEYQRLNKDSGQIDFEDMISVAAQAVRDEKFRSSYRYILVDEFQDISPGRAELVGALRNAVPICALFAVGDDWQSIYRFAGSDIGAMTQFSSIFGPTRRIPLDTTFRFDDYAISTSSRFVLKNSAQITKELQSVKKGSKPSVVLYKRRRDEPTLNWGVRQLAEVEKPATVLILERYNHLLPDASVMAALKRKFPDLSFKAMTVHGAKGLEADYVIAGLGGGRWGFPATKSDDPILNMVLTQTDAFPYGEERRLFYVALTRARRKTYLICETGATMSVFAAELDDERVPYKVEVFGVDTAKLSCRKCKSGTMILRDGVTGKFYGCSNFPLCNNTEQTCPACQEGLLIGAEGAQWQCTACEYKALSCPRCKSGVLQQKTSQRGPFVGCSNYRDPEIKCRYTQNGTLQ